jgi:hypothetical protein
MVARVAFPVMVAVMVGTWADAASAQKKGRYKKEGGKCVWVNEEGPNQCEPPKGRFKKEGDDCVWDANDGGNDQCTPKKGRFKRENGRCVWDRNDSGPNQCSPRG